MLFSLSARGIFLSVGGVVLRSDCPVKAIYCTTITLSFLYKKLGSNLGGVFLMSKTPSFFQKDEVFLNQGTSFKVSDL